MNFSGISNRSILGQLLRMPLQLIPAQMQIPILQGRLKGKYWIVGSGQHGCWLGSYEYDKQILFEQIIREGSVVFDLGAHVGFYTLLASTLVGSTGQVVAFEPLPANLSYLKQHLQINKVENVQLIEAAVADQMGTAYFQAHSSSFQGRLSAQGQFQVQTVSLDELIAQGKIPKPDYLKIDVEGAEFEALQGAKALLQEKHPTIFLATHGEHPHQKCCEFLKSLGYQLRPLNANSVEEADEILVEYSS